MSLPYWLDDYVGKSALATALTYQRHGVSIFPCYAFGNKAKAPHTRHGWHEASCDELQIRQWWRKWGNALVGLPCQANGIIVLDADHHGNVDGVTVLFRIFDSCNIDPNSVPCVITPRDGRHYIFRRPQNLGPTKATVANGIDVRDLGYIIAAGSVMFEKRTPYSLVNATVEQLARAISQDDVLPELPQLLIDRIAQQRTSYTPIERPNLAINPQQATSKIAGLIRTVVSAAIGQRNNLLYWASCRAGELVADGAIPENVAQAMLFEAASHAGLKTAETIATIRSGLERGRGSLRHG
jgi:hypothetical protein